MTVLQGPSGVQLAWAEMIAEDKQKREELRKSIAEQKVKIKNLAEKQTVDKRLLRKSHGDIPEMDCHYGNVAYTFKAKGIGAAGFLMNRTRARADEISQALIRYLEMRGKPFEQHIKKWVKEQVPLA